MPTSAAIYRIICRLREVQPVHRFTPHGWCVCVQLGGEVSDSRGYVFSCRFVQSHHIRNLVSNLYLNLVLHEDTAQPISTN